MVFREFRALVFDFGCLSLMLKHPITLNPSRHQGLRRLYNIGA